MSNDRPTGIYSASKDPRVDRAISWTLTAVAATSLAVGAYFFKALDNTVADLTATVSELRTEIAVARVERREILAVKDDLKELAARVSVLERTVR